MKTFDELNNIDKAMLLHDLFPDQIKPFVEFMEQTANGIITEPQKVKDNWGGKQFSADGWIKLAEETDKRVIKNGSKLITDKRRFSDQLFHGYTALFTLQCMQDYLATCPNSKFIEAIGFLFDV